MNVSATSHSLSKAKGLIRFDSLFDNEVNEREDVVLVNGLKSSFESFGDIHVVFHSYSEAAAGLGYQGEVRVLQLGS